MILKLTRVFATVAVVAVVGLGCGDDPVQPVDPPRINVFSADPIDILPGDSSLVTYRVTGADSVKLFPDNVRLIPPGAGEHYVKPLTPTLYGLVAYNKGGKDSLSLTISMSGAVPSIDLFDLSTDTILIGDSTELSWVTTRTDSIVVDNGLGRLTPAASGQLTVIPSVSTTYRAIAFNTIGTDTSTVRARVEIPFAVNSIFGQHYKAVMGGGIQEPDLRLRIWDEDSIALRKPWLRFGVLQGDGLLTADSVLPDASGLITNNYVLSGVLGHALIRALVPGVDSLDLKVRASVLRLGAGGQGQYIKFDDNYGDVVGFNGQPAQVDPDDDFWINYADYEDALGVVFSIIDDDRDEQVDADEPINEIFVNTIFSPTTPEGIGIGSSIQDVRAAYDTADYHYYDPTVPPAEVLVYGALGAYFWASTTSGPDSSIFEIHLGEPHIPGAPAAPAAKAVPVLRTNSGATTTTSDLYRPKRRP